MKTTVNKSIIFQSGLTSTIVQTQKKINTRAVENYFKKAHLIEADFKFNKPVATTSFLAVSVLENISGFLKGFRLKAPSIKVFSPDELITDLPLKNFCIQEDQFVTGGGRFYKKGSIFYKEEKSLEEIDYVIEQDFINGKRSSGHFLAETIHEMMHSIYLDYITENYKENSRNILNILETKTFSPAENCVIAENIGQYATNGKNQFHEVFAETFTQVICKLISNDNINFNKNPLDIIKKYPPEFQKIIKKVLAIN